MFLVTFTMLFSGGIIPLYLVVTRTLGLISYGDNVKNGILEV